jgi:hypothetical protein
MRSSSGRFFSRFRTLSLSTAVIDCFMGLNGPTIVRSKKRRRLAIEVLESRQLLALTPIISEFLASNSDGLRDRDGDSSDWIEIYNPTSTSFPLEGWRLTDSANDLNQWVFPDIALPPNEFLVVFASDKDRRVVGEELHTNFRLSTGGEFLALVDPSGAIVSSFAPSYPRQTTNISYGPRFENQTLVDIGSSAKSISPTDANHHGQWYLDAYDDSTWPTTPVGIGFGLVEPGFNVEYFKSSVAVNNLSVAYDVINTPSLQTFRTTERHSTINFMGNGGGGNFGLDNAFPTQQIGDDINDFVIRSTSSIMIPSGGQWTFGVNSDDGFRLILERDGTQFVSEFPNPRAPANTLSTFTLNAGLYNLTLVMYERAGGASVELFAALGAHTSVNTAFKLVGDVVQQGLSSVIQIPAGPTSPIRTDVQHAMLGLNSTAYLRIPFEVDDLNAIDSLRLNLRYDDGFIAYINGVQVVSRNAPLPPNFNSSALQKRELVDTLVYDSINLTQHVDLLREGINVLAIQGMNSTASDSSFFLIPQLIGSRIFENEPRYFTEPSPGRANIGAGVGIVDRPIFSIPAGFYVDPQTVQLTVNDPAATIRFTIDGSTPSPAHGQIYSSPILVTSTTVVRAVAYREEYVTLPTVTQSYFFVDDIIQQATDGQAPAGWPTSWGNNVVDYGMDPQVVALEGAAAVKNALLAIPSLNITTDLANLFDPAIGIYANAYNDGRDWERPASFELLNPDGTAGFQVNAGVRIRGGYSRSPDNPKHSFRLLFRGSYGDATLNYPIAGLGATTTFDKIDLRTAQNYSWSFGGDPSNNFVTDVFNRLSQQAMGMPSTSSQWYHLYLNGQYWGLFQTQERAEADFAATYFGGLASDYDVIKAEAGPYTIYATDGNLDAWYRLWDVMQQTHPQNTNLPLVSDHVEFLKLQGKNPDGTDNPNYEVLLDVDNLAVYMIGILFGGNLDAPISNFLGNTRVNNFYALRDRTGREGFKFFQHDAEHTLRNVNENRNGPWPAGSEFSYSNPQWFHQRLMTNAEYRMRFADLVQNFFFNGGPLTIGANQERFLSEAAAIDRAIIAESARWGDAKRPDAPLTRADWLNAVNEVANNYFPLRNAILLQQFRNTTWNGTGIARLFPTVDAPQFLVNGEFRIGGNIEPESTLRFLAGSGIVYYTTDGSDPRLVGGLINPDAFSYESSITEETLFAAGSQWKYRDNGVDLGSSWRAKNFNDSAWASGLGEFGYGDGDEATVVSFGPNANNKYVTTYFRKQFAVSNISEITKLTLGLKRDDGAVVYINGVEAARSNMPSGAITFQTFAASVVGGADETRFYELQIDPNLLHEGVNVIAVEIHQVNATSSDLSFDATLKMTRQIETGVPMGLLPTTYRARLLSPTGEWSALEEATFTTVLTPANASNLIVTELHYNPAVYTGANAGIAPFNDRQNFEFLELRNVSNDVILLDGVSFTGIAYTFPTSTIGPKTWLLPGELIVVAKNQIAFAARYGASEGSAQSIKLALGDYGTSNLNNGGELIRVFAANGDLFQEFEFDDNGTTGWPTTPDGSGYSLTPIFMDKSLFDSPTNWRASFIPHGTPGFEESDPPQSISLTNNLVPENQPSYVVGELSALDPDLFENFVFELLPELDHQSFVINERMLSLGTTGFDFEVKSTYQIRIRVIDAGGLAFTRSFNISVEDRNDRPVASAGGPYSIGEGLEIGLVGSGNDQDAGQALTFEWDLDFDGSNFQPTVSGTAPVVAFPDQFATRLIALRVTDNGTPPQNTIVTTTLTVTNIAPALTITTPKVTSGVGMIFTNSGSWFDTPADNVILTASIGTITKNADGTWAWSYIPVNPAIDTEVVIFAADEDGGMTERSFLLTAIAPPTVSEFVFGDGTNQRSMITSITIQFDSVVQIQRGAFSLERSSLNVPFESAVFQPANDILIAVDSQTIENNSKTQVTLTFATSSSGPQSRFLRRTGASLTDGNYLLKIDATKISANEIPLDGDDDGLAGGLAVLGSDRVDRFYRLFGDVDGDGAVSDMDIAEYWKWAGSLAPLKPTASLFDFNMDGTLDRVDFVELRRRHGTLRR